MTDVGAKMTVRKSGETFIQDIAQVSSITLGVGCFPMILRDMSDISKHYRL